MNELRSVYGQARYAYRSMWYWGQDMLEHSNRTNSLRFFNGDYHLDVVDIDIDYLGDKYNPDDISDNHTQQLVEGIMLQLSDLGVPDMNILPTFSGTGYNILLPAALFGDGFKPANDLPARVKETMKSIFGDDIDNIYDAGRIYRVLNTLNEKSGLYKIPLTLRELRDMPMKDVRLLAQSPRNPDESQKEWREVFEPVLADEVREPLTYHFNKPIVSSPNHTKVAMCIADLWRGEQIEQRNNSATRIISHYRRNGIPQDASEMLMRDWAARVDLPEKEIATSIKSVYEKGYTFGCNDPILKSRCNHDCVFYRKQNYEGGESMQLLTIAETHDNLVKHYRTDWTGRIIDIAKQFELPDKDIKLYPGNVIVVMGPTGIGKSAMATQLVLDGLLPTIYSTMEVSAEQMQRRLIQTINGEDKKAVGEKILAGVIDYQKHAGHIMWTRDYKLSLDDLASAVTQWAGQFQVLVIDHIKLVSGNWNDDMRKIADITRTMKEIALEHGLIIIEVSQVSKGVARNAIWDAYSGSGNSSIGEDADMVLIVKGDPAYPERNIQIAKNRDGDSVEFDAVFKNFRFQRPSHETRAQF